MCEGRPMALRWGIPSRTRGIQWRLRSTLWVRARVTVCVCVFVCFFGGGKHNSKRSTHTDIGGLASEACVMGQTWQQLWFQSAVALWYKASQERVE